LYLAALVGTFALTGTPHFHPIWNLVTGIFVAERVVTVRDRGWRHMAFAGLFVIEMTFDIFLQAVQAKAFWDTVRRNERNW
jgi:hypothetical protein